MAVVVQSANQSRMRRIIYFALRNQFSMEIILQVLWVWQLEFSTQKGYHINEFVDRVTDVLELDSYKHDIRTQMIKSSFVGTNQLTHDPWEQMTQHLNLVPTELLPLLKRYHPELVKKRDVTTKKKVLSKRAAANSSKKLAKAVVQQSKAKPPELTVVAEKQEANKTASESKDGQAANKKTADVQQVRAKPVKQSPAMDVAAPKQPSKTKKPAPLPTQARNDAKTAPSATKRSPGKRPKASGKTVSQTTSNRMLVFNAVVEHILIYVENESSDGLTSLKQYLIDQFSDMSQLEPATVLELHRFCSDVAAKRFHGKIETHDMVKVLHQIYVWNCQQFGADRSDRLHAAALNMAIELPQARTFSPLTLM